MTISNRSQGRLVVKPKVGRPPRDWSPVRDFILKMPMHERAAVIEEQFNSLPDEVKIRIVQNLKITDPENIVTPEGFRIGSRVKYPTEKELIFNQQDGHSKECPPNDFLVTKVFIPTWNEKKNSFSPWRVGLRAPGIEGSAGLAGSEDSSKLISVT